MIEAAGGVVLRHNAAGAPEVAVIHRPRYEDWSLPKGKLEPGETWEEAAVREVEEETGYRCRIGEGLGAVEYTDSKGRPKVVRYWLMEPLGGEFEPGDEADELRWVEEQEALALLTYERDRELVADAVNAREVRKTGM